MKLALLAPLFALAACTPATDQASSDLSGKPKDATLTFDASWNETTSGPIAASTKPHLSYDASRLPTCRGEQNGIAQWALTAHYKLNGGPEQTATVAGLNAESDPRLAIDEPGDLEMWFQATNRWGCVAYDSNFGANYHFVVVEDPTKPKWIGNAASVVSRQTCNDGKPCDADRKGLDQGFLFDTWARQRAAITGVFFDVYRANTTEFDNPDLWKELDVEVHLRPTGASAFETRYVDFFERHGNDARYQLSIRSIDPLGAQSIADASSCPSAKLTLTPDGQYVETSVDFYFTVNGKELRPAPGKTFVGRFQDYANTYAPCMH